MKPAYGMVNVSGRADIETVHIEKGQYVTVWMEGVQIELRMTSDGKREIYTDGDVAVMKFANWKAEDAK